MARSRVERGSSSSTGRDRRSLLARSAQGFMTGLALGVLWALWVVRRRRPGPDLLDQPAGGSAAQAG